MAKAAVLQPIAMAPFTQTATFTLLPGQLHIWQFHLSELEHHLTDWVDCLCPEERDRMARFVFERDRSRYGLSRGGLRQLLGRYVDQSPAALEFEYEAKGKPYLRQPGQRSSLQFNLSHSGDWVVYGISCDRPLGIDIEQIRPLQSLEQFAQRCLTPCERQSLGLLDLDQAQTRFFEYWTSKEAYLKATGQGLTRSMTEVEVNLQASRVISRREHAGSEQRWRLHLWQPQAGYRAALVYPGVPCQLHYLTYSSWWGEPLEQG